MYDFSDPNKRLLKIFVAAATIISLILAALSLSGAFEEYKPFENIPGRNSTTHPADGNINEEKSFPVDGVKRIKVTSVSTNINIIPADTKEVKAHFHGSYSSINPNNIPRLLSSKNGDTIEFKIEHKSLFFSFNFGRSNLEFELYIPREYAGDLEINTTSADVHVPELNLRNFTCKTVSGNVFADKISGDDISVDTTSGDTKISASGDSFGFRSVSGGLVCESLSVEKANIKTTSGGADIGKFRGDLDFESISGDLSAEYEHFDNEVDARTTSGSIRLNLPEDAEFYLKFDSASGNIENAFPITVTGSSKRNSLEGTVGNGKGKITVRTVSGNLKITK